MFTNSNRLLIQSIENLRADLSVLARNTGRIEQLEKAVNELSARVAAFPQPLRSNWIRHSAPAWERETLELPAIPSQRSKSSHLTLLATPAVDKIADVHICINGTAQYAYAYDANERLILKYTGWLTGDKLLELLAASQGILWKEMKPGSPEWDEAFLIASA